MWEALVQGAALVQGCSSCKMSVQMGCGNPSCEKSSCKGCSSCKNRCANGFWEPLVQGAALVQGCSSCKMSVHMGSGNLSCKGRASCEMSVQMCCGIHECKGQSLCKGYSLSKMGCGHLLCIGWSWCKMGVPMWEPLVQEALMHGVLFVQNGCANGLWKHLYKGLPSCQRCSLCKTGVQMGCENPLCKESSLCNATPLAKRVCKWVVGSPCAREDLVQTGVHWRYGSSLCKG